MSIYLFDRGQKADEFRTKGKDTRNFVWPLDNRLCNLICQHFPEKIWSNLWFNETTSGLFFLDPVYLLFPMWKYNDKSSATKITVTKIIVTQIKTKQGSWNRHRCCLPHFPPRFECTRPDLQASRGIWHLACNRTLGWGCWNSDFPRQVPMKNMGGEYQTINIWLTYYLARRHVVYRANSREGEVPTKPPPIGFWRLLVIVVF